MGLKVKNWKRRLVTLLNDNDNVSVHYFADAESRLEKGSIALFGYFVRKFNEAEEKRYGPHGLVLQHRREGRRRWLFRADTSQEQVEWIQALTAAVNLAVRDSEVPGVVTRSFMEALKTTRSIYGFFGNCVPRGRDEVELLLGFVTNVVQRELAIHLSNNFVKTAAGQRSTGSKHHSSVFPMSREEQRKALAHIVEPIVRAKWTACYDGALPNRLNTARSIRENIPTLVQQEAAIIAHIDIDLGELVQPIALEQYSRILEPLVSRCLDPLLVAWEKCLFGLVRDVLARTTAMSSIRAAAAELHELRSGPALHQGIGGEGPLAGSVLTLWRLETEDLGAGLAEVFAPSDAVDLSLVEQNHTLRNNMMMNAANVGEELSPEVVAGVAAAALQQSGIEGAAEGEHPECDGRLFTAMSLDIVAFAQSFLATVERLLLRPEEGGPLLWTLHEQNMRSLQAMDRIIRRNETGPAYQDEVMLAVSRSFSLLGGAGTGSTADVGLGDGYWVNDGFRTVRLVAEGLEAELLGIWCESTPGNSADRPSCDLETVHPSSVGDIVPVLFAHAARLDHLRAESDPAHGSNAPTAKASGAPLVMKDAIVQALRCSSVLATRDITASIRRRLRETALAAMENAMQETVLGTAGDIAADLIDAPPDGGPSNLCRPSMFRPSRFPHSPMFEEEEDEEEDARHAAAPPSASWKQKPSLVPRPTLLPQSHVRLLAEERARELMARCVDRMLDKSMAEISRRFRMRVLRLLDDEMALPGTSSTHALSQSVSMAAAIRTVSPSRYRTQSPPRTGQAVEFQRSKQVG